MHYNICKIAYTCVCDYVYVYVYTRVSVCLCVGTRLDSFDIFESERDTRNPHNFSIIVFSICFVFGPCDWSQRLRIVCAI